MTAMWENILKVLTIVKPEAVNTENINMMLYMD